MISDLDETCNPSVLALAELKDAQGHVEQQHKEINADALEFLFGEIATTANTTRVIMEDMLASNGGLPQSFFALQTLVGKMGRQAADKRTDQLGGMMALGDSERWLNL